jgi:3-deoxy-manno-octulosonate cytidylyltransferase (CMP-KDO synthetase)
MRTLAVIPARLGATRLPRKPLRLLAGVPLVIRVWERVSAMNVADRCVIATDSDEVVSAGRSHDAEVLLTAAEHPSGTDRVAEVAARPEFEPFVSPSAVRGAVALVANGSFELGTAAALANSDILGRAHVVKVVAADDLRAMYFSRAPIPFLRDTRDASLRRPLIWQHIGVYAYTSSALARWVGLPTHPLEQIERLEQLRPLAAGMAMGVALVDRPPHAGIDTDEDLARANAEWADFTMGRI